MREGSFQYACAKRSRQSAVFSCSFPPLFRSTRTNNGSRKLENSGFTVSQFYEYLRKNRLIPLNLDVNNPAVYKKWLIEKLSHPDFVEAISPFLKKLGFR